MSVAPRRPRDLRHRGVVETRELWLDAATVDEAGIRRRVLELWHAGAIVARGPDGVLVTLPAPVRFDTRLAPGLPIVAECGRRTTAPLHPRVLADAAPDSLLLLRGGTAQRVAAGTLVRVDPSEWIELGTQRPVAVLPLGDPPVTKVAVPTLASDDRERFGIGPDGADEVGSLVRAMAAAGAGARLPDLRPGLGARALSGLLGVAARAATAPLRALGRTRFQTLLERLDRWSARLGFDAAFARLLGEQNARYLTNMLELFDRDDLMQALRHAIPLSSVPLDLPPARGGSWLSARGALEFGPVAATRGQIGLGQELFQHLQRKYRDAHATLDRQGRFREAAWVLAELLGKPDEAVTYLDDRDQLALAAELAEVQALDPGLVVLLWIRAGNIDRALSIARIRGGWAAALAGLERRGLEVAPAFRLSWAWFEAEAGRFVAAAELAWAHPPFRRLASGWLRRAIEVGGTGGARAIARLATLEPEALAEITDALAALLEDPDPTGAAARRAFAAALERPAGPLGRALHRQVARALLRDAVDSPSSEARRVAWKAVEASGDGALQADLPRLPVAGPAAMTSLPQRAPPLVLEVARADTGTTPILDAVPLPRGRMLVALGALGARIVDREGRALTTFATPTHHLVSTPEAGRILLVDRRGGTLRVTRLDPTRRALLGSFDVEADRFCDAFDGSVWFVAREGEVSALDAVAESPRSLWTSGRLSESRPPILAMRCDPGSLAVAVSVDGEIQRFRYELPGPTLRERRSSPVPPGLKAVAVTSDRLLLAHPDGLESVTERRVSRLRVPDIRSAVSHGPLDAAGSTDEVVVATSDASMVATVRARLRFDGAARVGARFAVDAGEGALIAWDDLGRLRVLALEDGSLRVDLRL